MSTTAHTAPAATTAKSLASSGKFKTFAVVFGFSTAALYVACDMMGWPLFSYHPATNRLEWFYAPPRSVCSPRSCQKTSPGKSRWRSSGSSQCWRFRCCSIR